MENPDAYVEKVLQIDPVVDLDYDYRPEDVVCKGPTEKSVYVLSSDALSNMNIVIQNITPPSLTTVTERCFRVQYDLLAGVYFPSNAGGNAGQFAAGGTGTYYPFCNAVVGAGVARAFPPAGAAYVAGAPATNPSLVGGTGGAGVVFGANMALPAFPLQSCLSTLDLRLNGNSTSIPSNDLICLQPFKMDDEETKYYASEFPTQRDDRAQYASSFLPNVTNTDNRNPFANNSSNPATQSSGSHIATLIYEAVAGGTAYRVYRFDVTEQLGISPLVWGSTSMPRGLPTW